MLPLNFTQEIDNFLSEKRKRRKKIMNFECAFVDVGYCPTAGIEGKLWHSADCICLPFPYLPLQNSLHSSPMNSRFDVPA